MARRQKIVNWWAATLDLRGVEKGAENGGVTVYTQATQKLERINERPAALYTTRRLGSKDSGCAKTMGGVGDGDGCTVNGDERKLMLGKAVGSRGSTVTV